MNDRAGLRGLRHSRPLAVRRDNSTSDNDNIVVGKEKHAGTDFGA